MPPKRRNLTGFVAAAGVGGLVLIPLVGLISAIQQRTPDPFTGKTPQLTEVIRVSGAGQLLLNSVLLSIVVAVGAALLGGWLAWVEHRSEFPGRRWLTVATLLPLAMPSYILAGTLRSSLGPGGWIGGPLGLPHLTGFTIAAVVLIVVTAPLVQLIVGAALTRTSAAEEEAARSLGASPSKVFTAVTLPRLRPAIGLSGLLALLYAISDFGAVAVLDCHVLTWRLYDAVRGQDLARAAVLGVSVLLATIPLFAAARFIRGNAPGQDVANRRAAPRNPLGKTGIFTTAVAILLTVGLGLILPISTLCLWVLDGLERSLPFASAWTSLTHTVLAALIGTLVTITLAWLPARITAERARRSGSGSTSLFEEATYITSALPGVLLALGLMQAALMAARAFGGATVYHALLNLGVLLFAGYAARFLAEVFAPLKTGFSTFDPRQVESARVLGAGPWKRFRYVTLPSLGPSLTVAFLIGFNAILKELPVTLLLGGATGLQTLSFRVWDRYSESLWHDAGAAGLLIVGLAMLAVVCTLPWRRDV